MSGASIAQASGQAASSLVQGIAAFTTSKKQYKFLREQAAVIEAERRRQGIRLLGAQRVAFATGGVDPTTGTPLDVQSASAGEVDVEARKAAFPVMQEANRVRAAGRASLVVAINSLASLGAGAASGYAAAQGQSGTAERVSALDLSPRASPRRYEYSSFFAPSTSFRSVRPRSGDYLRPPLVNPRSSLGRG